MNTKNQDTFGATYTLLMDQRPLTVEKGCPRCGCEGIHACTGSPIVWTDDDRARLKQALGEMFGWEKAADNAV